MPRKEKYTFDTVIIPTSILLSHVGDTDDAEVHDDMLYLHSRQFILSNTDDNLEGKVYTYLGPNGLKLRSGLSPTEAPISCLVSGHKPKTKWRKGDIAAAFSAYESGYVHWWMGKYGQVECKTCGALLRERQHEEDPVTWKWKQLFKCFRRKKKQTSTPNTPFEVEPNERL